MPNYLSRMKPNGANGTEYKLKDEELREAFDVFKEDIKGTQTATGNPITLTDASETYAQGLSVELEPKQDLHGYDFPWVGGAGKNKLPLDLDTIKSLNTSGTWSGNAYTVSGATFTVITDDGGNVTAITKSGTPNADINFHINGGNEGTNVEISAILSGCPSGGSESTYYLKATYYNIIDTGNGSTMASFWTRRTNADIVVKSGVSGNLSFKPMIRLSTETDPTFAPYSNICPISGYEGVEVDGYGDELIDITTLTPIISAYGVTYTVNSDGSVSANGTATARSQIYWKIPQNTAKTFAQKKLIGGTSQSGCSLFLELDASPWTVYGTDSGSGATISDDIANASTDVNLILRVNQGTTVDNLVIQPMITNATISASVTFGQTVYGGSVDLTTGVLTVTHLRCMLKNLTENYFANGTYSTAYRANLPVVSNTVAIGETHGAISNMGIEQVAYWGSPRENEDYSANSPFFAISTTGEFLAVYDNSTTITKSDFLTKYNDFEVCYPLATPQTIQLTPEELKLLQDTNNLTTNGTTITLDYIPNNSIGDAVKASEEYTDRAVERVAVAPKATLIDTWMISEESDTISVDLTSYDCNFFLLEYLFNSKRGTTLIPRPQGGSFSASVVTYNNGSAYYVELTYNPTTKELAYTSNITSQFGILAIYTI